MARLCDRYGFSNFVALIIELNKIERKENAVMISFPSSENILPT